MTRRESVRVVLFARGTLRGADRAVRCAIVNLSAGGARLTMTARLPKAPLQLELELDGVRLAFDVEVQRVDPDGGVAVSFPRPHSERLHRLLAAEQRRALAQGRVNISERRLPPAFHGRPGDPVDRGEEDTERPDSSGP
jgi:hypothetical protein